MANLNIYGILKATMGGGALYDVDCIVEQGTGYIRYNNGLQICWGNASWNSTWAGSSTVNFVLPFATGTTPSVSVTPIISTNQSSSSNAQNVSNMGFTIKVWGIGTGDRNIGASWYAIGKWK